MEVRMNMTLQWLNRETSGWIKNSWNITESNWIIKIAVAWCFGTSFVVNLFSGVCRDWDAVLTNLQGMVAVVQEIIK